MSKTFILLTLSLLAFLQVACQHKSKVSQDIIRLNQVGYYPDAPKSAVVISDEATEFYIAEKATGKEVYRGKLSEVRKSIFSDKKTRIADFSELRTAGTYTVVVPSVGESYIFEIK